MSKKAPELIKEEYTIKDDAKFKIAVVSDLHEHRPDEVLDILRATKPDVIAVPGDLFERHEYGENLDKFDRSIISRILCVFIHLANKMAGLRWRQNRDIKTENSYTFLREANIISPVVICLGNHELYLTKEDRELISESGTILLENNSVEIMGKDGQPQAIFGGVPSKQCTEVLDYDFLKEFSLKPGYKVLLCHHPEYYKEVGPYADLILSGHCHGGQIRVFGRGVFAPGQGLFPKYHHGEYTEPGCGTMIVSSGCSNTASIPRWGNPCEVVVVEV